MKKLSEIGRYVDFEGEGNDWSDALGEPELENCPVIVMKLEERRELVRAVWDAALDHVEFDSFSGPRLTKGCDEFIKEQEL